MTPYQCNGQPAKHTGSNILGFFSAFGKIVFAYNGASCYPVIQVDMKKPDDFPFAVTVGILGTFYQYGDLYSS